MSLTREETEVMSTQEGFPRCNLEDLRGVAADPFIGLELDKDVFLTPQGKFVDRHAGMPQFVRVVSWVLVVSEGILQLTYRTTDHKDHTRCLKHKHGNTFVMHLPFANAAEACALQHCAHIICVALNDTEEMIIDGDSITRRGQGGCAPFDTLLSK